jgi:hypothetical protein
VLDPALLEVIEDLVAGDLTVAGNRARRLELMDVEVADAPRQDLARLLKLLEGGDRVLERMLAGPVQEIRVQPVGPEPAEDRSQA